MNWDVFISYASEDKDFARALALSLEEWGLKVWFDEFALSAGDSLSTSVNEGLAGSDFGIVILSTNFFEKPWPKKELEGLFAREMAGNKVIIPVWHKVTIDQVRNFSPMLADKLSILSTGHIGHVAEKIIQSVYKARGSGFEWKVCTIALPDKTEIVPLPIYPWETYCLCLGKYPITNDQYRLFVKETARELPLGEEYVKGTWRGPFIPWDDHRFCDDEKPVVCVDYDDANAYCRWVNELLYNQSKLHWLVFIPGFNLWDYAAYGQGQARAFSSRLTYDQSQIAHYQSASPAPIDRTGKRDNKIGISDLFGNVWEWCQGHTYTDEVEPSLTATHLYDAQVRGGSFLDDLTQVRVNIPVSKLADGLRTRHFDLGFRIAAVIPLNAIPREVRLSLYQQPRFSVEFWANVIGNRFFNKFSFLLRT